MNHKYRECRLLKQALDREDQVLSRVIVAFDEAVLARNKAREEYRRCRDEIIAEDQERAKARARQLRKELDIRYDKPSDETVQP